MSHPKLSIKQKTRVGEDVEKLEPCALLVGMKNGTTVVEDSVAGLKKLNIELPGDLVIPFVGTCPYKLKAGPRSTHTPMFIPALLPMNGQKVEATQVSIDG